MPRDSSGNYTLPAGNPVVTGTTISSSGWGNPTMTDIATVLTASLDRSGNGGMLAAFKAFDGTVSAPGIAFVNEPTTGFYRVGTGQIALSLLGSQKALFGGGNGTMQLNGGVGLFTLALNASSTSGQSYGLFITGGTTSTDVAILVSNQSATASFLKIFGDGHGFLGPNATNSFAWGTSGNFNVNAASAAVSLTVYGAANQWTTLINGSSTTSQSYGLLVQGGTNATDLSFYSRNYNGSINFMAIYGDGHGYLGYNGSVNTITWNAGGNVLINAAQSGTQSLGVTGPNVNGSNVAYFATSISTASQSFGVFFRAGTNANDYCLLCQNYNGSLNFAEIDGNGNLFVSNGAGGGLLATPLYVGIPQTIIAVNYTTLMTDGGKHIYANANSITATIAANGSVAYPIGTAITFTAGLATGFQIAINSDTLYWAAGGGTGTRSLAQYGVATALKIGSVSWLIAGTGLS